MGDQITLSVKITNVSSQAIHWQGDKVAAPLRCDACTKYPLLEQMLMVEAQAALSEAQFSLVQYNIYVLGSQKPTCAPPLLPEVTCETVSAVIGLMMASFFFFSS